MAVHGRLLVVCSRLLMVCGHLLVVCGPLLVLSTCLLVVCGRFLVVSGRLHSFVLICGGYFLVIALFKSTYCRFHYTEKRKGWINFDNSLI